MCVSVCEFVAVRGVLLVLIESLTIRIKDYKNNTYCKWQETGKKRFSKGNILNKVR